jgi:hypothetical protein
MGVSMGWLLLVGMVTLVGLVGVSLRKTSI